MKLKDYIKESLDNKLKYDKVENGLYIKDTTVIGVEDKTKSEYDIPDYITSIRKNTFYGCTSLKSITIPDSVTSIGTNTFRDCTSLSSITIPSSVISIGDYAFYGCILKMNNNSKLDAKANNYWGAIVYDTITKDSLCINDTTIVGVKDKTRSTYNIPSSVTSIGDYAFNGCTRLKSITIPDSVTTIGDNAFEFCPKLTSINIPDSVTSIGSYAFYNCTNLTSITIPSSATFVAYYILDNCSKLSEIKYTGTTKEFDKIANNVLKGIKNNKNLTIKCSDGQYDIK